MNGGIVEFGKHVLFTAVEIIDRDHKVFAVNISLFNHVGFLVHESELLRNQNDEYYKIHLYR